MTAVLDASALLAYLQQESGCDAVKAVLNAAVDSTVNWAEVIQKARAGNVDTAGLRNDLVALGLKLEPFTVEQAEVAGELRQRTQKLGLSLGDRACLALGLETGMPVYTADRAWRRLNLGIPIEAIR